MMNSAGKMGGLLKSQQNEGKETVVPKKEKVRIGSRSDMRNIQRKNPQNVDVQNNSTQVLPRGFEDFWNLENETSDSEVSFRGSWVQRRNVDV